MYTFNEEMISDIEKNGLQASIENLDLSVRAYNALKRSGINTLEDLSNLSYNDLMGMRNVGARTIHEIMEILGSHDFWTAHQNAAIISVE